MDMVLSQAERARVVVKWYAQKHNLPMSKVGELLGYTSASAFSQVINGDKRVPESLPERLAALDPAINPEFVRGGSNDMLLDDTGQARAQAQPTRQPAEGFFIPAGLAGMFADLSATVRSQQETIALLVKAAVGAEPQKDML